MANTVLVLKGHLADFPARTASERYEQMRDVISYLEACVLGVKNASVSLEQLGSAVAASGTLTISGGAGAVGGTIGGTLVTVTWATSDTATATALAAAINANTTVNKWVSATSAAGVVTLTALIASHLGNNVTLVASGTGVTASGAKLTGGSDGGKTTYTL